MSFSHEFIEEVLEKNNITDIVGEYIELKRKQNNFIAICPFHSEKTPSFTVSEKKQIFYCFGCKIGGNAIHFVMKEEHINFRESIELLAKRANIPIPENYSSKNEFEESLFSINREACSFFFNSFNNETNNETKSDAADYLKDRGISKDTIKKFQIGFARQGRTLYDHFLSIDYGEEKILESGLVAKKEEKYYDRFQNKIIFPISNSRGMVVGFGARGITDSIPKYINTQETSVFKKGFNLFGIHLIEKNKAIILAEGYMDAITLNQNGFDAVASLGTALTQKQVELLKRFTQDIYLCYDNDEAGKKAQKKAAKMLISLNLSVKIIILKNAKDPDEFLNKFGKECFKKLIHEAPSYIDHCIKSVKNQKNTDIEKKIKQIDTIIEIFSQAPDEVRRELYVQKISDAFGISKKSLIIKFNLQEETNKNKIKNEKCRNDDSKTELNDKFIQDIEVLIISLMLEDKNIKNKIDVNLFVNETSKNLFKKISDDSCTIENVCDKLDEFDEEERNLIVKIVCEQEEGIENEIFERNKALMIKFVTSILIGYKIKRTITSRNKLEMLELIRKVKNNNE